MSKTILALAVYVLIPLSAHAIWTYPDRCQDGVGEFFSMVTDATKKLQLCCKRAVQTNTEDAVISLNAAKSCLQDHDNCNTPHLQNWYDDCHQRVTPENVGHFNYGQDESPSVQPDPIRMQACKENAALCHYGK